MTEHYPADDELKAPLQADDARDGVGNKRETAEQAPSQVGMSSVDVVLQELQSVRMQRRMTQAALAERSGVKQSALARLEAGKSNNPTLKTLTRVTDALGLEIIFRPKQR